MPFYASCNYCNELWIRHEKERRQNRNLPGQPQPPVKAHNLITNIMYEGVLNTNLKQARSLQRDS